MSDKLFARFREGEHVAIISKGEPTLVGRVMRTYWNNGDEPIVVVRTPDGIAHRAESKVQHLDGSVAFLNDKINQLIVQLDGNEVWPYDEFPTNDIKNIESSILDVAMKIEHLNSVFAELQYVVALRREVVEASLGSEN